MSEPKPEAISKLVEDQVNLITEERVSTRLRQFLIAPRRHIRQWDYGKPGESFPCWLVAEFPGTNTGIAYSEHGFGPGDPWGLVRIDEDEAWFGMDSGWFLTLEAAFRDSFGWDGENPPGYEVP